MPDAAPFADANWAAGGLVTEVIRAALGPTPGVAEVAVKWDRTNAAAKAEGRQTADIVFPVFAAGCDTPRSAQLCTDYLVSDPIFEVLELVFVRQAGPRDLTSLREDTSAVMCHPRDPMFAQGPTVGTARVVLGSSLDDCFRRLMSGQAQGVVADELSGWLAVHDLGMADDVQPLETPFGTLGVHAVIPRTHWRATAHLYRVNAGLAQLRASGDFEAILARHLEDYRARVSSAQDGRN